MRMISKHISADEATKSITAIRLKIDNSPSEEVLKNMEAVANNCFEPLREWYGKPIKVNSFYRSKELNKAVGGSATSDHMIGASIDMDAGSRAENKKLFDWCKANLKFKQLINEYDYSWVHISFLEGRNNNQVLIIK